MAHPHIPHTHTETVIITQSIFTIWNLLRVWEKWRKSSQKKVWHELPLRIRTISTSTLFFSPGSLLSHILLVILNEFIGTLCSLFGGKNLILEDCHFPFIKNQKVASFLLLPSYLEPCKANEMNGINHKVPKEHLNRKTIQMRTV